MLVAFIYYCWPRPHACPTIEPVFNPRAIIWCRCDGGSRPTWFTRCNWTLRDQKGANLRKRYFYCTLENLSVLQTGKGVTTCVSDVLGTKPTYRPYIDSDSGGKTCQAIMYWRIISWEIRMGKRHAFLPRLAAVKAYFRYKCMLRKRHLLFILLPYYQHMKTSRKAWWAT